MVSIMSSCERWSRNNGQDEGTVNDERLNVWTSQPPFDGLAMAMKPVTCAGQSSQVGEILVKDFLQG